MTFNLTRKLEGTYSQTNHSQFPKNAAQYDMLFKTYRKVLNGRIRFVTFSFKKWNKSPRCMKHDYTLFCPVLFEYIIICKQQLSNRHKMSGPSIKWRLSSSSIPITPQWSTGPELRFATWFCLLLRLLLQPSLSSLVFNSCSQMVLLSLIHVTGHWHKNVLTKIHYKNTVHIHWINAKTRQNSKILLLLITHLEYLYKKIWSPCFNSLPLYIISWQQSKFLWCEQW
jgi:hypothetical protein